MLHLRQLAPLMRSQSARLYAKKVITSRMAAVNKNAKQVHQETLRHINPYSKINICSDIELKIQAADFHEYPDGDALIVALHGGHVNNSTAEMQVDVNDDKKQVNVIIRKTAVSSDFHCQLDVPVRGDLKIACKNSVTVRKMYNDNLYIDAQSHIYTQEIRSENIAFRSEQGDIKCDGMLLGKNTMVEALNGGIAFDQLQGDKLNCKTKKGNISTNSCYVEDSTFETNSGCLNLKNMHKTMKVMVHKKGDLTMTGVLGNIHVRSSGGKINLQLTELIGENSIISEEPDIPATINISDKIEENSYVEINSTQVALESNLSHLSDCISEDKKSFRMSLKRDNHNKLMVNAKGAVQLGKLSWAENMAAMLGVTTTK